MANADVSRLGQIDQSGDVKALFLKKFAGEVLAKFQGSTVMEDKHFVRSITEGKSASFPAVGGIDAEYHTPGEEITGLGVNHAEKVITIDDLLISHAFIASIDEAMNHYDVRSIYSQQMGNKLAVKYDKNVLVNVIKGARASALTNDGEGGTIIEEGDLGSDSDKDRVQAFIDALFDAATELDEKDVPDDARHCILKPGDYYKLVKTITEDGFSVTHKDYGTSGSFAAGNVIQIGGINIHKSNNLPTTDISDDYHEVNASTTKGVVFTPMGAGTVQLMDLATEAEWDIRRQGWLMLAKMAVGHGYLRPECCVELRSADPTA